MSSDLYPYLLNLPYPQRKELQYLIAKEMSSHNSKLIPLYCKFSISIPELGQAVLKNKLIDYLHVDKNRNLSTLSNLNRRSK